MLAAVVFFALYLAVMAIALLPVWVAMARGIRTGIRR